MKNTAYWIAAQAGVTPLAVGMPGAAKTAITQAFARAVGRNVYTMIGSLRDPADIGGYPYPESGRMRLLPPDWAAEAQQGKWIIFFDELTTCPPAVQAAMLRVIAEKVVGDTVLPSDTWMMAAANPPDVAANGMELEPPMANRLCHLTWEVDWESWDHGLANDLIFPEPTFPLLPDNWRSGLSLVGNLAIAFRRRKPELFAAFPTDRAKASGPWPSPRSWTNAVLCLTAAQSVSASFEVQFDLVSGCIGPEAGTEFMEYVRNLDLPDPEELIAEAIACETLKRPDELLTPIPARQGAGDAGQCRSCGAGERQYSPALGSRPADRRRVGQIRSGDYLRDSQATCAEGQHTAWRQTER